MSVALAVQTAGGLTPGPADLYVRVVDYVVSAGHEYRHPRGNVAARHHTQGVPWTHMYRTDLGDDESADGSEEWARGRVGGVHRPARR